MELKMNYLKSALLCLMLVLAAPSAFAGKDYMMSYTAKGTFEEVRDKVVFTIEGRGLVINTVSHIGEMLERTGKDLGAGKQIFLKAESLEFCSATVSRSMMEADPRNIVFCPYVINVYVLPADPKTVHITFRKPDLVGSAQSRKALKAVEDLLNSIIKEAIK
jgi:uncharacterized protein (DUF302 family)